MAKRKRRKQKKKGGLLRDLVAIVGIVVALLALIAGMNAEKSNTPATEDLGSHMAEVSQHGR